MLHVFFIPADANSVNVTPPQDTPMSNRKDGNEILFVAVTTILREPRLHAQYPTLDPVPQQFSVLK